MNTIFKLKFPLTLILLFCVSQSNYSQLQNKHWYFGDKAALKFNDQSAAPSIIFDNHQMQTNGGSASLSDNEGNLLFYTDGITVWNKNHEVMPNGSGLFGSKSVSQSVLIVPKGDNQYYIFTNQATELDSHGLSYSIVDLGESSNDKKVYCDDKKKKLFVCHNGNTICVNENALEEHLAHGDTMGTCSDTNFESSSSVLESAKNISVLPVTSEKLTAIANPNEDSYWLVSFAPSSDPTVSDTFYTFKVDENGVTLFNESTFEFPFTPNTEYTGGQMKISSDATALVLAHNTVDRHERYGIQNYTSLFSFDFDSATGKVSAYNQEFIANDLNFYGVEFSPDSKLLYVTGTHIMSDANSYPIREKEVGRLYQIPFKQTSQENMGEALYEGTRPLFGMQLGLDGRIYVVNASGNLSVINSPNSNGFDANFEFEKINLNGQARRELPQWVPDRKTVENTFYVSKNYNILENPVRDKFKIKFKIKDSYHIEFYSSMGVNLKHISFNDAKKNKEYEINISDLSPGIYFLTIKDSKSKVWEETIIKQ